MRAITLRSADAIVPRNRRLCASSLCTLAILLSLRAEGGRAQTNKNEPQVRFLAFEDERGTLAKYAHSELPGSKIATPDEWDKWIREQDRDVRSRIDRGVEDSISNLILYGTSFTKLPRLANSDEVLKEASATLNSAALARVRQLIAATEVAKRTERVEFVAEFLQRKRIAAQQKEQYLAGNLARYVEEQRAYQRKLEEAGKSGDKGEILAARGTLYVQRGLSVDT